jgi:tRNA pseudouridine38-40 synthase
MARAADQFRGLHNFSLFARASDKNPLRNILSVRLGQSEGLIFFQVTADSFLWHMVRYMASALAEIGRGSQDDEMIRQRLAGENTAPIPPAPAEGLVLWEVDCGVSWTSLPVDRRSFEFLEMRRAHHSVMSRVCNLLMMDEDTRI